MNAVMLASPNIPGRETEVAPDITSFARFEAREDPPGEGDCHVASDERRWAMTTTNPESLMTMRRYLLVVLCALLATASIAAQSTATLERSVGRLILENDRYPYGGLLIAKSVDREYNNIRRLPVQQRVRFFWSVLMNIRPDAGYSVDLHELIARDCPAEFEREIEMFLKRDWSAGPPQPQADIAKRTLLTLQMLRERDKR